MTAHCVCAGIESTVSRVSHYIPNMYVCQATWEIYRDQPFLSHVCIVYSIYVQCTCTHACYALCVCTFYVLLAVCGMVLKRTVTFFVEGVCLTILNMTLCPSITV